MLEFTVEKPLSGIRIDSFLSRHLRNYTSYRLQRMIRAGMATRNGGVIELETRVFAGQDIAFRLIEPPDKLLEPEPGDLEILFEDPWILALNKPAGIVAHPVGEFQTGTLANVVQTHLDRQTKCKGLLRPGIVHRLDRMTSGVIVLAKEHISHTELSVQFQKSKVQKAYVALVEGQLIEDRGEINLPIGHAASRETVLMSAAPDARKAKPACTRYEVIERFPHRTLIRALPKTGRIHQIRIHFATIGHPVVGDEFYEIGGRIKPPNKERNQRHALHASQLAIQHPITKLPLSFEAPLPNEIRELCSESN
ncbi:MAG: RluA family pseudouridine synthase [Planctomycetaceae bacterium]|nr:RluA family pseudouridine synthase [Planctomycetaceae bacterium]